MYKQKINSSNVAIAELAKLPKDDSYVVTWYGGLKKKVLPQNLWVNFRTKGSEQLPISE